MRVVIQRVKNAAVKIDDITLSVIGQGMLILLGIETNDNESDVEWLCSKIAGLRIFNDSNGVMNLDIKEIDGDLLVVSQFTLHAKTKKGNRPSYINAAVPELAIPLYKMFVSRLETKLEKSIKTGEFGAMMEVSLINDGPVTILIDSKNRE